MSSIPISQGYISKLSESTKKRSKLRPARKKGGDDNSELGGQLPTTKRTAHGWYWNKIYIECNVESVRIHDLNMPSAIYSINHCSRQSLIVKVKRSHRSTSDGMLPSQQPGRLCVNSVNSWMRVYSISLL
ncbi:hypothetical protein P5673_017492 [Acropora cervicornis]|uniref:Uncharacterized protein n=1 Tax=Acropora cervicornis TaxID=6130 RepID=A0AAD9QEK2_ACRCE|nr:hypothetical protein P5673_017492 [Acropora cervicornis]